MDLVRYIQRCGLQSRLAASTPARLTRTPARCLNAEVHALANALESIGQQRVATRKFKMPDGHLGPPDGTWAQKIIARHRRMPRAPSPSRRSA
ncbi:hypothetical protein [Tateyamaria sp. SN3-11]|uniref:hypothetical protein n=1 Tax=Tateyamaria sp. SN3-11 TaxID=3092147 RepID=UPI0039ED9782